MNNQKLCFISQCSEDRRILEGLHDVLGAGFSKERYAFFDTSREENSTTAGAFLSPSLMKPLQEADVMIAVITDSYVRSVFCLAEVCNFWLMGKPVIPLVYCEAGRRILEENLKGIIYIDLIPPNRHADEMARKMINSLEEYGFISDSPEETVTAFRSLFSGVPQAKPVRPYIGSLDTYENINRYCEDYGVSLFKNSMLPPEELSAELIRYEDIYILATTGANLVRSLRTRFIPAALKKGINLHVLIPNRYSDFVNDVAEVESPSDIARYQQVFANEMELMIANLKGSLKDIRPEEKKGRIFVGYAGTLLRQTIILARKGDAIWGWLSVTMPPGRTIDGTPSLRFSGKLGEPGFASVAFQHVMAIRDYADRHHLYCELTEQSVFSSFYPENQAAEAYWRGLADRARQNTLGRDSDTDLIEVAAQHPLRANGTPGKEFSKRLDYAVRLYQEIRNDGQSVKIYVPGSVHCYKGKQDPCSLSDAGIAYLLEKGIPGEDLLGKEENERYKKDRGVYNTADECYVASRVFFDGDYRRLHCVCSPNQLMRKKLFYLAFGVIPFFYTINSENPAHDDIYELFHALPDILSHDHTWQAEDSENGRRTRQERDPRMVFPEHS